MTEPYAEDSDTNDTMIGEYANYISVGSIQTEFYIDFRQTVPGGSSENEQILPVRRILISPMLIRGLVRALEDEITSYESSYGVSLPTVDA